MKTESSNRKIVLGPAMIAELKKKVNQEAASRLENTVFIPTGHKTVTTN